MTRFIDSLTNRQLLWLAGAFYAATCLIVVVMPR